MSTRSILLSDCGRGYTIRFGRPLRNHCCRNYCRKPWHKPKRPSDRTNIIHPNRTKSLRCRNNHVYHQGWRHVIFHCSTIRERCSGDFGRQSGDQSQLVIYRAGDLHSDYTRTCPRLRRYPKPVGQCSSGSPHETGRGRSCPAKQRRELYFYGCEARFTRSHGNPGEL